ncbi:unnamed protein product, partial [marine sediment metagenome]
CIFVMHQVDNQVKRASAMRRPRRGDAAECKSFENWMQFCIQYGVPDDRGRLWLSGIKHRFADEEHLVGQIDDTISRINYEPERFKATDSGFIDTFADRDSHRVRTVRELEAEQAKRKDSLPNDLE